MHISLRENDTDMTQTEQFPGLSPTREVLLYTNSNTWRPFIYELLRTTPSICLSSIQCQTPAVMVFKL